MLWYIIASQAAFYARGLIKYIKKKKSWAHTHTRYVNHFSSITVSYGQFASHCCSTLYISRSLLLSVSVSLSLSHTHTHEGTYTVHPSEVMGQSLNWLSPVHVRRYWWCPNTFNQRASVCYRENSASASGEITHNLRILYILNGSTSLHYFMCHLQSSQQRWETSTC